MVPCARAQEDLIHESVCETFVSASWGPVSVTVVMD